jgi:hypothetical protein
MPYEMAKAAETTIKWRLRPYRISNMNVGKVRSTEIFLIGANYLSGDIELYLRSNQIDYVKTEHMSSEELLLRGVPQQTVCQ